VHGTPWLNVRVAHLQRRSMQDRQLSQSGITRHCSTQAHLGQKTREPCPAIEALYRGNQEYMKTMGLTNPGLLQDLANEGQRTCFVPPSMAVKVPRGTFCSLPCVLRSACHLSSPLISFHPVSFCAPSRIFAARMPHVTNPPPRAPIYAR
jgi:hypothetical protein